MLMNGGVWLFWIVVVLASLVALVVPQLLWVLSSWQYRDADAMEPSERRYRVLRIFAAVVLIACAAFLIGNLWPGDTVDEHRAGFAALLIGDGLLIAGLVVWRVSAWGRRRRAAEDEPPPNEPSGLGYLISYIGVVMFALIFVFVGATMLSVVEN
jgi:ABC-type Fe3+ transport system permease subunit